MIPPQINKFDKHLYIFALFAKYHVYFEHKVEANIEQIYLFASLFTHVTEASYKNICTCFSPVLLQEQIYSYTLHLYYYQTNKFTRVISRLLSTQIWSSLMNLHKYHLKKFPPTILIIIRLFEIVSLPFQSNRHKTYFIDYKLWCVHKTAQNLAVGDTHSNKKIYPDF